MVVLLIVTEDVTAGYVTRMICYSRSDNIVGRSYC